MCGIYVVCIICVHGMCGVPVWCVCGIHVWHVWFRYIAYVLLCLGGIYVKVSYVSVCGVCVYEEDICDYMCDGGLCLCVRYLYMGCPYVVRVCLCVVHVCLSESDQDL